MFHLFSSYFLYPTIFFSSPSSSFSLLPPVWHRDKSILALTPNVRKSGQTLCEIDVNPMTAPNMMIYHITNAYVGACAVGLARSSCQLYLPHPFHDKEKGSYLIDCTFNGMHVHRGNTTLVWEYPQQLQTKSESIIWRKIPQISVGLAVMQESKKIIIDTFVPAPPDTPDNICNLWLFFFSQFIKSKLARDIWNVATVDLLVIHGFWSKFWNDDLRQAWRCGPGLEHWFRQNRNNYLGNKL